MATTKTKTLLKTFVHEGKVRLSMPDLSGVVAECGQLEVSNSWCENGTGYAVSVRKDTGKRLETMVTKAQAATLGLKVDTIRFFENEAACMAAFALRINLEQHFAAEISEVITKFEA